MLLLEKPSILFIQLVGISTVSQPMLIGFSIDSNKKPWLSTSQLIPLIELYGYNLKPYVKSDKLVLNNLPKKNWKII